MAISAWRHCYWYRGTKSASYLPQNSNSRWDYREPLVAVRKILSVFATINF